MATNLPNPLDLKVIEYYDLSTFEFNFKKSEQLDENGEIISKIIQNFADKYELSLSEINEAFRFEEMLVRTTEPILLIYQTESDSKILRTYTNVGTETFQMFFAR